MISFRRPGFMWLGKLEEERKELPRVVDRQIVYSTDEELLREEKKISTIIWMSALLGLLAWAGFAWWIS